MFDDVSISSGLRAEGLSKSFGAHQAVVDVNLDVPQGSIVGFLGPNGAGKTTVMSLLAGLMRPDTGRLWLLDQENGQSDKKIRSRLGFLQEKPRIYPDMTADAYLRFFADLYGAENSKRRVEELLDLVGLKAGMGRVMGQFSRGMQQRACLARVLIPEPDVLMLDEPMLGLDPVGISEMREIFFQLRSIGKTLFFSSHQLAEMERVCDSLILMNHGRTIAAGPQSKLASQLTGDQNFEVELFEANVNISDELSKLPGLSNVLTVDKGKFLVQYDADENETRYQRAALSRLLSQSGWTVLKVSQSRGSLEDLFLQFAQNK